MISDKRHPWLNNDFDFYFYDLAKDEGFYAYYKDIESINLSNDYDKHWKMFYFLDLNKDVYGNGTFYYYRELECLRISILENIEDEINCNVPIDEEDSDTERISCIIPEDLLNKSRLRQDKWYDLYIKENGLPSCAWVDEQDLLDWLGAYCTITKEQNI